MLALPSAVLAAPAYYGPLQYNTNSLKFTPKFALGSNIVGGTNILTEVDVNGTIKISVRTNAAGVPWWLEEVNTNGVRSFVTNEPSPGDLLVGATNKDWYLLNKGSSGQVLKINGTNVEWGSDNTGAPGGGITTINTASNSVQFIVTGTNGVAPNWVDNGNDYHTNNIPWAGGWTSGALHSNDWQLFRSSVITNSWITNTPNTIYVATNGNDLWPGTLSLPKLTPSNAIASATSGDTVFLLPGHYNNSMVIFAPTNGSAPINVVNKTNLLITGPFAVLSWPTGMISGVRVHQSRGIRFQDLEIRGYRNDPTAPPPWASNAIVSMGVYGTVEVSDSEQIQFDNVTLRDGWDHGILVDVSLVTTFPSTNAIIVRNCWIERFGQLKGAPGVVMNFDGAGIVASAGAHIENNYLVNCSSGIEIFPLEATSWYDKLPAALLVGNTVVNSRANGINIQGCPSMVTGNRVTYNATNNYWTNAVGTYHAGIDMRSSPGATVLGNSFDGYAISLYILNVTNAVVQGNQIRRGTACVVNGGRNVSIVNNVVSDIVEYWELTALSDSKFSGNQMRNMGTNRLRSGSILVSGSISNVVFSGNTLANDVLNEYALSQDGATLSRVSAWDNDWSGYAGEIVFLTSLDSYRRFNGIGMAIYEFEGVGGYTNVWIGRGNGTPIPFLLGEPTGGSGIALWPTDLSGTYLTLDIVGPGGPEYSEYKSLRYSNAYLSGTIYATSAVVSPSATLTNIIVPNEITLGGVARSTWPTASSGGLTNPFVLYVSKSGDNSTALIGRPDKPYADLGTAMSNAPNGSVIQVGAGWWTNHNASFFPEGFAPYTLTNRTNITIRGESRDTTVLYQTNYGHAMLLLDCSNIKIERIGFYGKSFSGEQDFVKVFGQLCYINVKDLVVEECAFIKGMNFAIVEPDVSNLWTNQFSSTNNIIIRGNVAREFGCWYPSLSIWSGGFWAGAQATVEDNEIHDCSSGIVISPVATNNTYKVGPSLIRNNRILQAVSLGIGVGKTDFPMITGASIQNNFVEWVAGRTGTGGSNYMGNQSGIKCDLGSHIEIRNNSIVGNLYGIQMEVTTYHPMTNNVVEGNMVYGTGTTGHGIRFGGSAGPNNQRHAVSRIANNVILDTGADGISVSYGEMIDIINNTIINASTNPAYGYSIRIAQMTNAVVRNNTIKDTGPGDCIAGMYTDGGPNNVSFGNNFYGITTEHAGGWVGDSELRVATTRMSVYETESVVTNLWIEHTNGYPIGLALGNPANDLGILLQPSGWNGTNFTMLDLVGTLGVEQSTDPWRSLRATNAFLYGSLYADGSVVSSNATFTNILVTGSITLGGDPRSTWPEGGGSSTTNAYILLDGSPTNDLPNAKTLTVTNGLALHTNGSIVIVSNTMSAVSGEANTASNLGSNGVFRGKVDVDLQFAGLVGTNGLYVKTNAANNYILFDGSEMTNGLAALSYTVGLNTTNFAKSVTNDVLARAGQTGVVTNAGGVDGDIQVNSNSVFAAAVNIRMTNTSYLMAVDNLLVRSNLTVKGTNSVNVLEVGDLVLSNALFSAMVTNNVTNTLAVWGGNWKLTNLANPSGTKILFYTNSLMTWHNTPASMTNEPLYTNAELIVSSKSGGAANSFWTSLARGTVGQVLKVGGGGGTNLVWEDVGGGAPGGITMQFQYNTNNTLQGAVGVDYQLTNALWQLVADNMLVRSNFTPMGLTTNAIQIGRAAFATDSGAIAIGSKARATNSGIAIGQWSVASTNSVMIGTQTGTGFDAYESVGIGNQMGMYGYRNVGMGFSGSVNGNSNTLVGYGAQTAGGNQNIIIGAASTVGTVISRATGIGIGLQMNSNNVAVVSMADQTLHVPGPLDVRGTPYFYPGASVTPGHVWTAQNASGGGAWAASTGSGASATNRYILAPNAPINDLPNAMNLTVTNGLALHTNGAALVISNTMSAASGEANTASNLGSNGVFRGKVDVDLQFAGMVGTNGLYVKTNSSNNYILFDGSEMTNGLAALSYTIGANNTNFTYSIGANNTNFTYSIGANNTNFTYSIGANDTNFTYSIGANDTNYINSRSVNLTNAINAVSVACSNLAYTIGANDTNFTYSIGANNTNFTYSIGANTTNFAKSVTNDVLARAGQTGLVTNVVNASTNWPAGQVGLVGVTNNGDVRIKSLSAGQGITLTVQGYTNILIASEEQTPWTSDINGANFALTNVGDGQFSGAVSIADDLAANGINVSNSITVGASATISNSLTVSNIIGKANPLRFTSDSNYITGPTFITNNLTVQSNINAASVSTGGTNLYGGLISSTNDAYSYTRIVNGVARNPQTNISYTVWMSTNTTLRLTNNQSGNVTWSISNPVDRAWFLVRLVGGSAGVTNLFLPMDGTATLTWIATNGCPNATNPAATSGKVVTISGRCWINPSPPGTNIDLFANVQP